MAVLTFNPFTGGFDVSPALLFPGALVIASGKTATINNTLTLAGTDGTTMTFPTTSATVARTDAAQTFAGAQGFAAGTSSLPSIYLTGDTTTGFYRPAANQIGFVGSATKVFGLEGTSWGPRIASGWILAFTADSDPFSTPDVGLIRSATNRLQVTPTNGAGSTAILFLSSLQIAVGTGATLGASLFGDTANTLALRNGAAAQTLRVYNTFTTVATAGEWWKADWQGTANQFRMGAVAGSSSGTNRAASWDYGDKLASATAAITVPATSGNIVFGGGVQLSNAAATGLAAGVLAATTNATIVLYDSTGQAYRVPCII